MKLSNIHQNKNLFLWLNSSRFWSKFAIYNFIVGAVLLPIYRVDRIKNFSFSANSERKARRFEGKGYVGAMSRAQQAYYLEHEKFANSLEELNIALPAETSNYRYQIWTIGEHGPFQSGRVSPEAIAMAIATPQQQELKSYSSVVWVDETGKKMHYMCETNLPSMTPVIPARILDEQQFSCPQGSRVVPQHSSSKK